ncbi:hypothetical protein PHLCEN_2v734 [Hermanssonia centrifuga]|uniref:Uncharacterized protein n=1 Tax=Hermanssonia centrifuga TaxID=98765 RepID=A0A2R6S560_9APHY|nr:hypothetical protein PHLCEN_2v734 [Hermanssonia centrifuga]
MIGFLVAVGFDYAAVRFIRVSDSYIVHLQIGAVDSSIGNIVAFIRHARNKSDEASKAEHMEMKSRFKSLLNLGYTLSFDIVFGALMYPFF